MWNEKKANQVDTGHDCMDFPFDHTRDLDLEVSRSNFEIALFQEWEGWLA